MQIRLAMIIEMIVTKVEDDDDTIYMSCDMQKVILLPRMLGYKRCLFTTRLVTINQSFVPIGKSKSHKNEPVAVLWHEAISGRKDKDVTKRKCFYILTSVITNIGLSGSTTALVRTNVGHCTLCSFAMSMTTTWMLKPLL